MDMYGLDSDGFRALCACIVILFVFVLVSSQRDDEKRHDSFGEHELLVLPVA